MRISISQSAGLLLLLSLVFTYRGPALGSVLVGAAASIQAPVVFNAPASARPGDIVALQGENFGSSPKVSLIRQSGEAAVALPLVSAWGNGWAAFKIPESATGSLVVRVDNGQQVGTPIKLNGARAYHLDALQIVPLGAFRIFGRNLLQKGFSPVVRVDGLLAQIDGNASDEHMLVVKAPNDLRTKERAVISVDNGNGSGPSELDRTVAILAGASGDPFSLGVGWAASFSAIASRTIFANNYSKYPNRVACDGVIDDTASIQNAIDSVANTGGGVVQLPQGNCRLAGSIKLRSKVVLQGSGKDKTVLRYEVNYPIWGRGLDLVGVRDMTLTNTRGRIESLLLQGSTRVFIQNVKFLLSGGIHMFLTGNTNIVIAGSDFLQPKNPGDSGPFVVGECGGLVFMGNSTIFANGAPNFPRVHDAFISDNRFTRDARENQNSKGVIHSFTMDFAHRIAVVGNTFDVLGGPIVNKMRNDGESFLTEGGGGRRTESLGTVANASATTLSDPSNTINVRPFSGDGIPENFGVAIVGGAGAGQTRRVIAYDAGTMTVDSAWDVIPDTSSRYSTFVWGLEKSLIKKNSLLQNPRGIWLYQTAVRDVDIVENTIEEGGGIYLRSAQNTKDKLFTPIYGVRIAGNRISNTSGEWRSYLSMIFVRMDAPDFGIGFIGIEVRENSLRANKPNLSMPQEESGGAEGYVNRMHAEGPSQALAKNQVRLLGTIFQKNSCVGCDIGVIVREGAVGTVQEGNRILMAPK